MVLLGKPCPTCGRPMPETAAEKFERCIDRSGGPDACWPYRGPKVKDGYGHIDVYLRGKISYVRAHRFSYEQANGPIPAGKDVLHACDVRYAPGDITYRACCNPAHLFLGTDADNHRHMWAAGRQQDYRARQRRPPINAVLTAESVAELRDRFRAGGTAKGLAPEFGITQAAAWNAIHGVTWARVPGAVPRRGRGFRHPTLPPQSG